MKKRFLYLAGLLLLVLICALASCDMLDDIGGSISGRPDCEHEIELFEGKEPTCTEGGWTAYEKCNKCGYYTERNELPALGHDEVWHDGKSPTCTEIGWDGYVTCNRCDYTTYNEYQPSGHSITTHSAKPATCTEIGWEDYESCYYCDYTTYVEIPATGHFLAEYEGQAPTCTENGWSAYVECHYCDYTTYREIWSNGHEWGSYATCTTDQTCNVCGEVGESALGHNPGSPATCEEAQYCQRCNELLEEAHGHDMVEYEGKAPTCVENGWEPYSVCRLCNYSTYNEIRATGHVEGPAATCTEDKICTECNEILERAFGHVAGNYADCENDSLCIICKEKLADALGHNEVEYEAQAPTCTEIGWDAYVACTRCSYSTYEEIPANGHDYVNVGDKCTVCSFMKASEGLAFRSNYDGTYYVSGIGECTDTTVVIPLTTPNGDAVTGIRANAFNGCEQIVNVILQDNIKTVGANAFEGCTALQSFTASEGMETIGASAFTGCTALEAVNIPDSVVSIGENALYGCFSLSSLIVGENNENYCAFDGMLFDKNVNTLIAYCVGLDADSVEIPATVTKIGDYAFFGCNGLVSISMASVTEIGVSAFENCVNLDNVVLPEGLTVLSERAFAGCTSLTAIAIPELITTVPDSAFNGCTALATVTFHDSLERIFSSAFENCASITEITFPETIKTISDKAFKGCIGLTEITVPDSAEYIGNSAFGGCSSLESVTLPFVGTKVYGNGGFGAIFDGNTQLPATLKTVTVTGTCWIPKDAFKGCTGLTNVVLSEKVQEIEMGAFSGCSSLESITLPFVGVGEERSAGMYSTLFGCIFGTASYEGSTAMDQYYGDSDYYTVKFYVPTSLKNVTVLGGELGHGAFSGCTTVENVEFVNITGMSGTRHFTNCTAIKLNESEGATYIGNSENDYLILLSISNKDITGFTVPDSTRMIVDGVFKDCVNLKKVVLPENLLGIGGNAFSGCTALSEINLPVSLQNIGSNAFFGCESLTSVVIPEGISTIEQQTFYGCKNLTSVQFSGTVDYIGSLAFSGCEKLEGIEIPEGCTAIYAHAFQGCTSLEYVKIPSTVKEIKEGAFNGAKISDAVYIPSIEDWLGISFSGGGDINHDPTYYSNPVYCAPTLKINGEPLTELVIPSSVRTIDYYAFAGCKTLVKVVIPNTVTTVRNQAFADCINLVSIEFPTTQVSFGTYVFSGCTSLESVTIPGQFSKINDGMFKSCTALKTLVLGEGIGTIGTEAFYNCINLREVQLSKTLTTIGYKAFSNCRNILEITIPARVTKIETQAFEDCIKLVEVRNLSNLTMTVGRGEHGGIALHAMCVHNLENYTCMVRKDGYVFITDMRFTDRPYYLIAYEGDEKALTLPSDRSYAIYNYAFYGLDIESVIIPDSVDRICESAFEACYNLVSVVVGDGVETIATRAFYGCADLQRIDIGKAVDYIGHLAFNNCNKLTIAIFENTSGWERRHYQSYPIVCALAVSQSTMSSSSGAAQVLVDQLNPYNLVRVGS